MGRSKTGSRGKTGSTTRTQTTTGNCPSCGPDSPIAKVMVMHLKTRWIWWCSNCRAEVSR